MTKEVKKKDISLKKILFIILAAIVCAFLLELIQVNTAPGFSHPVVSDEVQANETNLYPDRMTYIEGYSQTETGLVTIAGDPKIYFTTQGTGEFSYAYFYFSEPVKSDEQVQIFYAVEGYETEENSVRDTIPSGTTYWAMMFPAGEYYMLRIDIDTDVVPIEKIAIGSTAPAFETDPNPIRPRRIIIVTILLIAILLWIIWVRAWEKLKNTVIQAWGYVLENKMKVMLNTGLFVAITGITMLLFWIFFYVIPGGTIAGPQIVFGILVGCFVSSVCVFRRTLASQPEYIFLVLILCLGFLFTYYMPHNGAHNWDEEFHYQQALTTSYVDELRLTNQDYITMYSKEAAQYDTNCGLQAFQDLQDARDRDCIYYQSSAHVKISAVSEVFNGIGLFIGRALGLRYYQKHFLGLFTGLLTYALAGFFAVRKLKSGKMIAAVVLLIPTGVFLASNYNYDSYLTVFTMLGLCYYIAQWQNRDEKLSLKDAVIMIGSITFGCISKPVYLPLLWILFLLPGDKFVTKKAKWLFYGGLFAAMFFLVLSYAVPMVRNNGGLSLGGDTRGGAEVSGDGQIKFILSHPFEYVKILWRYLVDDYLNPEKASFLFTFFAYDGLHANQFIYLVLLVAVAVTDKSTYDLAFSEKPWRRIWPMIVSIGTMILAVTSMYIIFTPVGYPTINGAQYRYLIPLYFPFLFHVGSGLINNKMNRSWYNGVVLTIAAYVGFADVFNAYVSHYF